MQVLHIVHLKVTAGRGVFEEFISCIKLQLKSTNFSGNASTSKSTYPNSTSFQFEFASSLHGSKHRQGLFRLLLWAAIKSRQIKISTSIWHVSKDNFWDKNCCFVWPGQQGGHLRWPREFNQFAEPLSIFPQVGHVHVKLPALHRVHRYLAFHCGHEGLQRVLSRWRQRLW